MPKLVRKQFVKELYKEKATRHLRIKQTREAIVVRYYFLSIYKIVERVVQEYNICNKAKALRAHLYRLLKLPRTLGEL